MSHSIHSNSALILIVDDDRFTRIMLRQILEKEGNRVEEVENGEQCLATYAQLQPDMVLLDAMMPEMDGFTCCSKLQTLMGCDRTPILMITGLDDQTSVDRAFEAGAVDYVTKPIHAPVLRRRVRRLLEASWAEKALRKSEKQYRSVVENLKEVIFQMNAERQLTFLNPAWTEITGFSIHESLGKRFVDFIHPDDRHEHDAHFHHLLQSYPVNALQVDEDQIAEQNLTSQMPDCCYQVRYLSKNGTVGYIEVYARLLLNGNGTLRGISGTLNDITKRKQAEEELQRQNQILQQELNQAADYVRSLLPRPITESVVTIEQQFVPSLQLGGDAFDYYWLDSEHLVMYLLDVAGHGVKSALLSVSVLNILRSQSLANTNFYQPSAVLTALNTIFQMGDTGDDYFTIWYGVYNQTNRTLVYACAGHPPALLLPDASTPMKRLEAKSIPIGMLPEADFDDNLCEIKPDSTLYLFSDGVYEIHQDNGKIWGLPAFSEVLEITNFSANNTLMHVFHHIQSLSYNGVLPDDFSLLKIRLS
jgi:serine phosphatase RsbU (regulator of sigma subunit)/CheY-like chemotaxis protein